MLLCVWWPTHPQRAGCWVVSADIPLPEPPWSGGEARQPAGRLLSRCALPSRSATADHSGGGGTSWTRLPGRFPHQRRKSPWTELGGEHTGMFCWRSGQTECESVFFFFCSPLSSFSDAMWYNAAGKKWMTWKDLWVGSPDSLSIFHGAGVKHKGLKYSGKLTASSFNTLAQSRLICTPQTINTIMQRGM